MHCFAYNTAVVPSAPWQGMPVVNFSLSPCIRCEHMFNCDRGDCEGEEGRAPLKVQGNRSRAGDRERENNLVQTQVTTHRATA